MVGPEPHTEAVFLERVLQTWLLLTGVKQRPNEQKQISRNFKSDAGQNFPRSGSLKLGEAVGLGWTELVKAGQTDFVLKFLLGCSGWLPCIIHDGWFPKPPSSSGNEWSD